MKKIMFIALALILSASAAFAQTATKYFVAHQGGYIGEATVTIKGTKVASAAYAQAARDDTLVNVTIDGLTVTVGKKASETVHYGHMNKADPRAYKMALAEGKFKK
jgi:hypothetical protein